MTHGQNSVEELPDEAALSQCLRTYFSENAKNRTDKLRFGAEMEREGPKKKRLKHLRDRDRWNVEGGKH